MFELVGWAMPNTCISEDCLVRDPLHVTELSPNLLLVLIHASAWNKETRDAIRDTYVSRLANIDGAPIQYRFDGILLLLDKVYTENHTHGEATSTVHRELHDPGKWSTHAGVPFQGIHAVA